MEFDYTLLTQYLNECDIPYQVDNNGVVSFIYEERHFVGCIGSSPAFDTTLTLILPGILEVSAFDEKKYLKLINKLNTEVSVVKFAFGEKSGNTIYIESEIPLDSSPEMDDLVPGLVKLLVYAYNAFCDALNK